MSGGVEILMFGRDIRTQLRHERRQINIIIISQTWATKLRLEKV